MRSDPELTSDQAADLAGLSRRFVAARIDAGDIPSHRAAGQERLVLTSDFLQWHERFRARQRKALHELVNLDDELELRVQHRLRGAEDQP